MDYRNKVLIVENDFINITLLKDILGDKYHLEIASAGERAVPIAADFRPNLILLGTMLPGISGYEICKQMRATLALRHTKIIVVFTAESLEERLRGYEAGADDCISKPLDPDDLLAKVRMHLQLQSVEELQTLETVLHHETISPLNGILLAMETLQEETLEEKERKMLLDMVYQSAHRLQSLFQKIIKLSALKSGKWEFYPVTVDVSDVIREAVRDVAAQGSERKGQIDLRLPDGVLMLLDPQEMKGVVMTLLAQAILCSSAHGRVLVRGWHDGQHFRLTIATQSKSIDANLLPQVFEEFPTTNMGHHANGQDLSLAIARRIVSAHNGIIDVGSTKQSRTTFTVQLPIVVPAETGHSIVPDDKYRAA